MIKRTALSRPIYVSRSKGSKYHARKVTVNGITFDSKHEAERYLILHSMERRGEITDLKLQVPYILIPAQRVDGKVVERSCRYVADFVYRDAAGNQIVEDAKGVRTPEYVIKRKLMLHLYGICIREV